MPPMIKAAIGLVACLSFATLLPAQDWQTLFDGKSLDGWTAAETPASFKLKDGEIMVHGPRGHLFYTGPVAKHAFRNFHFSAEVKTTKGSNSGIFFHTAFQPIGWPNYGYESQVNTSHTDWIRSGSLYGVKNIRDIHTEDDKWYRHEIIVKRNHITVKIDGKIVVDWDQPKDREGTKKLGRGTFALQAHDPESKVFYRDIKVRVFPKWRDDMSRAERTLLRPDQRWWERMDYGPFLSSTVDIDRKGENSALKGITVELAPDRSASATFDTDLLRMAAGQEGWLELTGVTYNGGHGSQPRLETSPIFKTSQLPGWMPGNDTNIDPRRLPHGPLPDDWGQYKGLMRNGEQVVFHYEVMGTKVWESPGFETSPDGRYHAITRTFYVEAPTKPLMLRLADGLNSHRIGATTGRFQVAQAEVMTAPNAVKPGSKDIVVVVDRTTKGWDELAMGAPSNRDLAHDPTAEATGDGPCFSFELSTAKPHHRSFVTEEGFLPRLNDGEVAQNHDDLNHVAFFDGGMSRMILDLKKSQPLERINTYSWHRSDRSPQRYILWASNAQERPDSAGDLKASGWKRLAKVDSRELGMGGKHASSVASGAGLGTWRYLLWESTPVEGTQGMFYTEIDVWGTGANIPPLRQPNHGFDRRPLTVSLLTKNHDVKLLSMKAGGKTGTGFFAKLPVFQRRKPFMFKVVYTRDLPYDSSTRLGAGASWKLPIDVRKLWKAGKGLYPEAITVEGKIDTPKPGKKPKAWASDAIPVPFENPWGAYMRLGGLDFFSDGDRAAVSTWNGDVWVVSGLNDPKLKAVKWKRFATGLFETLGVRILDDLIYVNGKDQVTRLHDLNQDGEADWYECFNNDVITTRNFHEFTFDLQTDSQGNFYFSKGAPVRGGGRGFTKITPHHGTVLKLTKDGKKLSVYARGLRAPNGIGIGPGDQITSGDNEGTWVPHCKLHWLKPGSFQGVVPVSQTEKPPTDYNKPLCWFPMEVDNSSGSQIWTKDERFGFAKDTLIHLSYGTSSVFRVLKEEVDGQVQGGVVKLPVKLASSAMRARWHPKTGDLWVLGLKGWQTNAAKLGGFTRIRRTKSAITIPTKLSSHPNAIRLEFDTPLDRELAEDIESYAYTQWNYVWSSQYGSPEVSAQNPDEEILKKAQETELHSHKKHDTIEVTKATLSKDGKVLILQVKKLIPAMQFHLKADLETADGDDASFDLFHTLHNVGKSKP